MITVTWSSLLQFFLLLAQKLNASIRFQLKLQCTLKNWRPAPCNLSWKLPLVLTQDNGTTEKHTWDTVWSGIASFRCCSIRSQRIRRQVDSTPSHWYIWALARSSLAHKVWVKKHNDHGYVIMEMAANPTVNLLQVWIPHFSLFCCFLQGSFHQPLCTSLHEVSKQKLNSLP